MASDFTLRSFKPGLLRDLHLLSPMRLMRSRLSTEKYNLTLLADVISITPAELKNASYN
jgi:hypothetical protein